MNAIRHLDHRLHLRIPDPEPILATIVPEAEVQALTPDPAVPLLLSAGRHGPSNANTLLRDRAT